MTDAEVPALFDRQMTVWLPKFYENSRRIAPAAEFGDFYMGAAASRPIALAIT